MAKKVALTIEQVRFIWSLGFMSGRVQESSRPKQGVTWEEETPAFTADIARLTSVNRQLSKKLQAANVTSTDAAQQSAQADGDVPDAVESAKKYTVAEDYSDLRLS